MGKTVSKGGQRPKGHRQAQPFPPSPGEGHLSCSHIDREKASAKRKRGQSPIKSVAPFPVILQRNKPPRPSGRAREADLLADAEEDEVMGVGAGGGGRGDPDRAHGFFRRAAIGPRAMPVVLRAKLAWANLRCGFGHGASTTGSGDGRPCSSSKRGGNGQVFMLGGIGVGDPAGALKVGRRAGRIGQERGRGRRCRILRWPG